MHGLNQLLHEYGYLYHFRDLQNVIIIAKGKAQSYIVHMIILYYRDDKGVGVSHEVNSPTNQSQFS